MVNPSFDEPNSDNSSELKLQSPPFLTYSMVFLSYGSIVLISLVWLYFRNRLGEFQSLKNKPIEAFLTGFCFALLIVLICQILTSFSSQYRLFMGYFKMVLGGRLSFGMIFVIALMSGVGEELLFRGTLQPIFGLTITSICFGFCHFPLNRQLIPWTVFALIVGFGLGYLQQQTGNLIAPISAHFWVNFLNLFALNRLQLSEKEVRLVLENAPEFQYLLQAPHEEEFEEEFEDDEVLEEDER